MIFAADEAPKVLRCKEKRPVSGKKKPVETTWARALVVGFFREASTAMRLEKVRILRMEGPVSLSARGVAMGAIMVLERVVVRVSRAEMGVAFSFLGLEV